MKASHIDGRGGDAALPTCWMFEQNAQAKQHRVPKSLVASTWAHMTPWFFFICLGTSSFLALWMSRGWIALFMSGQLFSAGSWLFRAFTGKMRPLSFASAESTKPSRSPTR